MSGGYTMLNFSNTANFFQVYLIKKHDSHLDNMREMA